MASEIDPQLQSIKKYFDFDVEDENRQFIIPEFQRAYSWTEEQCEELWTDINIYFQTCGDKKNMPWSLKTTPNKNYTNTICMFEVLLMNMMHRKRIFIFQEQSESLQYAK